MNELYHHGVRGMKWGTRKAGKTTTADIKKARSEVSGKQAAAAKAKKDWMDNTNVRKDKQLEKTYRQLDKDYYNTKVTALKSTNVEKGSKVAGSILGVAGGLTVLALTHR